MEKLVLVYSWGDEGCSGEITIPFEFTSKLDFCLEAMAKIEGSTTGSHTKILGIYIDNKSDIERLVFTLDEWFTLFQEKSI